MTAGNCLYLQAAILRFFSKRPFQLRFMAISKILATHLFDGTKLYPKLSQVLVYNSASGEIVDLLPRTEFSEDLPIVEGLIAPGLVNVHCHLELSHLENQIAKHCGLPKFLLEVVTRRQVHSEEALALMQEKIFASLQQAYSEGTRVIGDIVNTELSLPAKLQFMRENPHALKLHNFVELIGFDAIWPEWKKQQFVKLYQQFINAGFASSMALHAPYSVSQNLLEYWQSTKPEISTIHSQESAAENALYRDGNGAFINFYQQLGIDYQHFHAPNCSSFQYFLPYLFRNSGTRIFVHNTFMQMEDAQFFLQQNSELRSRGFFAICARANEYIEGVLPSAEVLQKLRENLVIGTDSLASNSDLSLLNELLFLKEKYGFLTRDLLYWACYNGARALGLAEEYGSFRRGAKPGIIRISPVSEEGELLPKSRAESLI